MPLNAWNLLSQIQLCLTGKESIIHVCIRYDVLNVYVRVK
jgi:hypothetical protein